MLLKTWESVDGSVKKVILDSGKFSKKPTEGANCEVLIEYVFNENISTEDLKEKFHTEILNGTPKKNIIIGEANTQIDHKIERAIEMMSLSERSLVTVVMPLETPGELITIKFEITLITFEPHKPIWEWTPEEKYLIALRHKEAGVRLFKESRCIDAFCKFSKACKILVTLEPIPDLELDKKLESDINNLRLILYNNMAGCQLNCKNFEHAISLCNKIIEKDDNNVKALYRRGVSHGNLNDLEKAVADLQNALTLEPHNLATKEQFLLYKAKLQDANKKFEDIVRRMFKA